MTWAVEELKHVLPYGPAVYFVMKGSLTKPEFEEAVEVLAARAPNDTANSVEDHWGGFRERLGGRSRWDTIVARHTAAITGPDEGRKKRESLHSAANILMRRPYTAFTVRGIQYILDLFNPADELGIRYRGAGEPVIALLLRQQESGTLQHQLVDHPEFYEIVRGIAEAVGAEYVCGEWSLAPIMFAYNEKRLDLDHRPWDFLYPLYMLKKPHELSPSEQFSRNARTTNDSLALVWPI